MGKKRVKGGTDGLGGTPASDSTENAVICDSKDNDGVLSDSDDKGFGRRGERKCLK